MYVCIWEMFVTGEKLQNTKQGKKHPEGGQDSERSGHDSMRSVEEVRKGLRAGWGRATTRVIIPS